jgi:hypothetical protein
MTKLNGWSSVPHLSQNELDNSDNLCISRFKMIKVIDSHEVEDKPFAGQ